MSTLAFKALFIDAFRETDRHVSARCRPPRRVAGSRVALQAGPRRRIWRRDRQRIQRIGDGLPMPLREVEIEDGVPQRHMPQEQLDRTQVRAAFE